MKNNTQIIFENCPFQPSDSVPDKIYLGVLSVYVNSQTAGIHSNEGGASLCYIAILAQPSIYDTQLLSIEFPVPINPGATITYTLFVNCHRYGYC